MSEKILSIIIPSCNMEKYLGQCLDSLLVSNLDKVEVLVINDGSKDRTSEIGHCYEANYPGSIRVIDKPNGHYGSCINCGLKEATGKYVKILDADDSFDTTNFEHFVDFLSHCNSDLVLSPYAIVDENRIEKQQVAFEDAQKWDSVTTFTKALPLLKKDLPQMHAICYKLQNLKDLKYSQTEGVAYTDQEWIFYPMVKVKRASYFPEIVYRYLVGREGQSVDSSLSIKAKKAQLMLVTKRIELYSQLKSKIGQEYEEYLFNRLLQSLSGLYKEILLGEGYAQYYPTLAELDTSLYQKADGIYKKLGELKTPSFIHCRYVNIWRNASNRSHKLPPILTLFQKIRSLRSRI